MLPINVHERVLVAHPGRQHSHQLALALQEADMLAAYWTGVPARRKGLISRALAQLSEYDLLPLPQERVRHCFVAPVARKVVEYLIPPSRAVGWSHQAATWFDYWCAWRLADAQAEAVVCYENAALETFRRAKARGMTTILDAASFHHIWQDRFYDYKEPDDVHEAITCRKDAEIALADHIFTVSDFARESYLEAGVPLEKVTAVPMGCDLERFEPGLRQPAFGAPFTFIFAGYADARKGIDMLIEASSAVRNKHPHRVFVAGDTDPALAWEAHPWIERSGRVPQEELAEFFRRADCFVLPSRLDSFGMVVVEAMATGLPVIVTENVGAKEAVTEGESGWVIPAEDAGALRERMAWCARHPGAVRRMRDAARRDARPYSWDVYHERVVEQLRAIVALPSAPV